MGDRGHQDGERTSAAERMRRYRRRRRQGLVAFWAEVESEIVDKLIVDGRLPASAAKDPQAVGAALVAWVRKLLPRKSLTDQ